MGLVGEVRTELLAEVARSPNVSVVRAPDDGESGLDAAARALRDASRKVSPFVLVAADPLEAVASEWRAMWDVSRGSGGPAGFEERAVEALAAWRAGRFELPDYYLVLAGVDPGAGSPDLHLGPLRAARPRRVVAVGTETVPEEGARVLHALRSLPQGTWWPPLDELLETARRFFAGALTADGGLAAAAARDHRWR